MKPEEHSIEARGPAANAPRPARDLGEVVPSASPDAPAAAAPVSPNGDWNVWRLRRIFESMQDGVVMLDREGRFAEANQRAADLCGLRRDRLIGRPMAEFLDPETDAAALCKRLQENGGFEGALRLRRPDGAAREVETHATPDILPGQFLAILHDVTERERLLREVQALNDALQRHVMEMAETSRDLEAFNYSVSHNLKSLLAVVDGYGQILEEEYAENLGAEGRAHVEAIRRSIRRMSEVLNGLLLFAQVRRQERRRDIIDMGDLARGVIEELRAEIRPDGRVELQLEPLPMARGDWRLVRQALANLLGNALKFSSAREPAVIEVTGRTEGDRNVYAIRDNGVGFDMRHVGRLFGVLQRLHRSDEFEGMGLGLAIARRIIERHGGRIWAEGRVGEGAVFSFTLPDAGAGLSV